MRLHSRLFAPNFVTFISKQPAFRKFDQIHSFKEENYTMFIDRLRQDFYDVISKKRVLVMVALDVDAICACRVLQWLFQCDHVQYTIVPVTGIEGLVNTYKEHCAQLKDVVMINCGGNINILESLEPEDDVNFFVIDSHRPLDLDNIYNQDQVKLLMVEGDALEYLPDFDEIYASDDEFEDEEDDEEPSSKRQRTDELGSPPRKKKGQWHKHRQDVLYKYYEFAFHGTGAAYTMYELAWKMSKDSNELLWMAITGVTDQFLNERIDNDAYIRFVELLQGHVLRLNHSVQESEMSVNCMRISFANELQLVLYRHWSLIESLCNSQYTACRFKVWTMKGKKRLHEFLADMGIPLVQCQQKFAAMDSEYRNSLKDWVKNSADKYGLEQITYGSFNVQFGFKNKLCASDVVYAISALLEDVDEARSISENFLQALDALSSSNVNILLKGLEIAKQQIVSMVKQVNSLIDMHQVVCAGPFLYAHVREGSPDMNMFSMPINLSRLARFLLRSYVVMTKNKKVHSLPFILSAPLSLERGTCLIVGIPPYVDESRKNLLGRAFEVASEKTKSRTWHDNFDPSIIEMKTEDRSKFFDALSALLDGN